MLQCGDPLNNNTQIGPLAKPEFVKEIDLQVKKSVDSGARILTGGKISPENDNIYLPTVIAHITEDMPVFKEETFGPVLSVIKFTHEKEAIRIANNSKFGLGASIWSKDVKNAENMPGK